MASAGRLGASVELQQIRLQHSSFEVLDKDELPEPAENTVDLNYANAIKDAELAYFVAANVLAVTDPPDWGFRSDCLFVVIYKIDESLDLTTEELDAFGKVTVPPTVVPYVRQLIQDMTARANLPPFVLPLWRIALV